jgi:small-conductance mechanosensitive channel
MLSDYLTYEIFGNLVKDYLIGLGFFLASYLVLRIFKKVIISKIRKVAKKTTTKIDDIVIEMLDCLGLPFYFILSLHIFFLLIQVSPFIRQVLNSGTIIIVTFYAIKAINKLFDIAKDKLVKDNKFDESRGDMVVIILKILTWTFAVIFVISNLGYDVTTLIAGLGIGGIAIGFALKTILDDIFASFSIYLDKPFEKGDFIAIGEDRGEVKHIGIKTTRLKTLRGEELVVSNRELTDSRINNYKKLRKRRVDFSFGVKYETPTKKLRKIPEIVKKILKEFDVVEIDRVHFKEFGDYSLLFEVVYYLNDSSYDLYRDVQQEINLRLMEKFEKEGIEFAYPTQTLIVNKKKR